MDYSKSKKAARLHRNGMDERRGKNRISYGALLLSNT